MEYKGHKNYIAMKIGHAHLLLAGNDGVYSHIDLSIEDLRLIHTALVNTAWSTYRHTPFKSMVSLAEGIERMLRDCGFDVLEDDE